MKRSSSQPLAKLHFDINQCQVGQSKVDRLSSRRKSACQLIRQPPPRRLVSEVDILKQQNLRLTKQNQQLKNELAILKTTSKPVRTETKNYHRQVQEQMRSKTKTSRVSAECLFETKDSLERSDVTITEWHENFRVSNILPNIREMQAVAERFFNSYSEHYAKLQAMFSCLQHSQHDPAYAKLNEQISLYKLPILYQKSPQALFRELSREKPKPGSRPKREEGRREELCWQTLSPSETVGQFEALLNKLTRSIQVMRELKRSEAVRRFVLKINPQF